MWLGKEGSLIFGTFHNKLNYNKLTKENCNFFRNKKNQMTKR